MRVSTRFVIAVGVAFLVLDILSASYLLLLVHFVSVQGSNLASATHQFTHIATQFAQVARQLQHLGGH